MYSEESLFLESEHQCCIVLIDIRLKCILTSISSATPLLYAGVYNETIFRGIDYVLAQAAKHNLKVIISLSRCAWKLSGKHTQTCLPLFDDV